jgi:NAD(P)-dependent dehydrogenase (short-subunit alcohol dehydrogenase family)
MIALVTGASSRFGRLIANALSGAGHITYASMRGLDGKNAPQLEAVATYAREHLVDLRALELDVQSEASAATAIEKIIGEHAGSTSSSIMSGTRSGDQVKLSHPSSSRNSTTSTCSIHQH